MSQFAGIYLEQKTNFIENDSITLTFIVYDESSTLQTDLSAYKFKATLSSGGQAQEIVKKDVNYSGGADSQIQVSGRNIVVKFSADDTDGETGEFIFELQMQNKTTGERQTIYVDYFEIAEEELTE